VDATRGPQTRLNFHFSQFKAKSRWYDTNELRKDALVWRSRVDRQKLKARRTPDFAALVGELWDGLGNAAWRR